MALLGDTQLLFGVPSPCYTFFLTPFTNLPLLNLRSPIFGLMPFAWLGCFMLTFYFDGNNMFISIFNFGTIFHIRVLRMALPELLFTYMFHNSIIAWVLPPFVQNKCEKQLQASPFLSVRTYKSDSTLRISVIFRFVDFHLRVSTRSKFG